MEHLGLVSPSPLYRPDFEHDACGVGFVANFKGKKSYDIIDRAITGLKNLAHRGAIDADAVTGDGAGIQTQIPYGIFRDYLESQGKQLYEEDDVAIAMVFVHKNDEYEQARSKYTMEEAIKREGLTFVAWRTVPVNPSCLGKKAELSRPLILQAIFARTDKCSDDEFERRCYLAMKAAERRALDDNLKEFYICSCSSRTITYKGLLNAPQVRKFFVDLKNPKFVSAFAMFHQRFATNTFPDWYKAQPFRMMTHNGEINTVRGNRNLMRAREYSSDHGVFQERYQDLRPIIQPNMSDSASFDNALQVITMGGRSCIHGVSMMVPSAWEKDTSLSQEVRDFYRYHSTILEPWDGPAAIVFTDGRFVGATLDRNGLRPLRYKIYEDDTIVVGSEAGVIPDWDSPVLKKGRLGPGRMLAVDLQEKRILDDGEIKQLISAQADFGQWCDESLHNLHELAKDEAAPEVRVVEDKDINRLQAAFGYDLDEREVILVPMAQDGKEPIGSMGDDTPMAVLSHRPRLLYTYFKQLFAQVTNPAIDPYREALVMSLHMYLGGRLSLFDDMEANHNNLIELHTPVLLDHEYNKLFEIEFLRGHIVKLDALFDVEEGPASMENAVHELAKAAREAVLNTGAKVIVLSDRGVCASKAGIPMLVAVGAVHQELVRAGLRLKTDIVCETGEARDVHQIGCLLGFGANAVYPYLVLDIYRKLIADGELDGLNIAKALNNYRAAIDMGIYKIMSKMGISTLFSYQGAQMFEALGIGNKVIDDCFFQTPNPIGGIGYEQIAEEVLRRHAKGFPQKAEEATVEIDSEGYYKVKKRGDGEFHGWSPKVVSGMNKFVRKESTYEDFLDYKAASDEHEPVSIKDLLKFRQDESREEIPLEEVEPMEEIRRRFTTAGMSLGAISPETHECLAIAMNRIGGKSNSGEGGEDPKRFHPLESGDNANSAIKQVASGRFGVSAEYLANAKEIEIKISQGAKPGEGGQLPGHKVTPLIARLRFSVPGVTLISPPPHHDIYSIEDLAQLIFDLKEVNPRAQVCVKLVSCSGVGTVAAGVAKAYADVILVSGHEGGTGASPISSIKHAGSAWEIGIAEAHQVLVMNDLRNRVTLRTDGGMKTGRDIVIAAILGAEEFNFGTAALIAAGCAMFRVCHLNTCPVGVATQREDLRAKFRGKPENVVAYFNSVAEDVRRILAKLGFRTLDEVIGKTELLEQIEDPLNPKTKLIDLGGLLHNPDPSGNIERIHTRQRNDSPSHEHSLDHQILQDAKEVIMKRHPSFKGTYKVKNTIRNVGTRISGEIGYIYGNNAFAPGTLDLTFIGSAGQSFGTFLVNGLRLRLHGEANDYVGKGMHAGEIIIRPKDDEDFVWHDNIIAGNTCLYGATGGYFFCAGKVGERFAVRNSGATAVVGGVGDHGCEYMTRGTVVVLGETGRNFGAGMSGGLAFVLDEDNTFERRLNPEMVGIERLDNSDEIDALKKLIELHYEFTSSPRAKTILDNWNEYLAKFWKVAPHPTEAVPLQHFSAEEVAKILV